VLIEKAVRKQNKLGAASVQHKTKRGEGEKNVDKYKEKKRTGRKLPGRGKRGTANAYADLPRIHKAKQRERLRTRGKIRGQAGKN